MTQPYRVDLTATAKRDLRALPEKIITAILEFAAGPLAKNPHQLSKPLSGELTDHRSARRGDYRVVLRIDEPARTVHIIRVAHRADAYRPI